MHKTKQLSIATWIIIVTFVALTAATYAWMSIATSYRVTDLELSVITENALEISLDQDGAPGEWGTLITAESIISADAEIRPVTWSAEENAFYAADYGIDGRISSFTELIATTQASDIESPSTAEAEEGEGAGYLLKIDFWLRTGASRVTASLTGPQELSDGTMSGGTYVYGEPIWNAAAVRHDNGGNGAENVIRIGFKTYDYYLQNQEQTEDTKIEDGSFYIYEPNTTPNEALTPSIDGEEALYEGEGKLIRQNPSFWSDQDPVLHGSLDYTNGDFIDDSSMFMITANNPRKVTMYIWLEGQDEQCRNTISAGKILANLQFNGDYKHTGEDIVRPEN